MHAHRKAVLPLASLQAASHGCGHRNLWPGSRRELLVLSCSIPRPELPIVVCKYPSGKVSFSFEVLNPALTASSPLCRVVKEEISDDNAKLPCFNGRVVSWVSKPLASVSLSLFVPSLKNTVWMCSAK